MSLGRDVSVILRNPAKFALICFWWAIGKKVRARNRLRSLMISKEDPQRQNAIHASDLCLHLTTLSQSQRQNIVAEIAQWEHAPKISVVMPVYNTRLDYLAEAIDSIHSQLYENWELCVADDASTDTGVRHFLEEAARRDPRLKLVFREQNGHICEATNSALELATGSFVALMDHDDRLTEDALYHIAKEIQAHPDAKLIYSDEDKIRADGGYDNPHFKPQWNEELFLTQNYLNHLTVIETSILRQVGGLRVGFEGSQDHDLILRVVQTISQDTIRHVPRILYHWRVFKGSGSFSDSFLEQAIKARQRAVTDYLERKYPNRSCKVELGPFGCNRIAYSLQPPLPKVTIIIPTKDRIGYLKACISSILSKTDYENYDIIIVDNDSVETETLTYFDSLKSNDNVSVIQYSGPFNFSAMNNLAVSRTDAPIIALVNNDIEVISESWLSDMVANAVRPEIGAVGAKLLYGNRTIQHAGILLGVGGVANHAFLAYPGDHRGYQLRLQLQQYTSAVTGACLVMERDKYLRVGGLDEQNFKVAYNDVDLCLKLSAEGLNNLYLPQAVLLHHESVSRGYDISGAREKRLQEETRAMKEKWGSKISCDPYYNPNFKQQNAAFQFDLERLTVAEHRNAKALVES